MDRLIRLAGPGTFFAAVVAVAVAARAVPPPDHTTDKRGALHAEDKDLPYTSHCTDCHAPDLLGGLGPSCRQCHGTLWLAQDALNAAPPLDHDVLKGGFALHKPGFGDPVANGCTQCHGPNLNDGFAPSCFACHGQIWGGGGPPADHTELKGGFAEHKPGYEDPFANDCTQCHGPNLNDGFATSCFACHGPLWGGNSPPNVDPGGPYAGVVEQPVQFDASGTVDPDGDALTYQWDFGDGSPLTSPNQDPAASHSYNGVGSYLGSLTVSDGVNDPVVEPFTVEISESPPCPDADRWLVTTTGSPPETFTVTFESYEGVLSAVRDDGVNPPSLAIGMEFDGVIFWMDIWVQVSDNVFWGIGDIYLGNIDRAAGTMDGVVFDDAAGMATFSGTESP